MEISFIEIHEHEISFVASADLCDMTGMENTILKITNEVHYKQRGHDPQGNVIREFTIKRGQISTLRSNMQLIGELVGKPTAVALEKSLDFFLQ